MYIFSKYCYPIADWHLIVGFQCVEFRYDNDTIVIILFRHTSMDSGKVNQKKLKPRKSDVKDCTSVTYYPFPIFPNFNYRKVLIIIFRDNIMDCQTEGESMLIYCVYCIVYAYISNVSMYGYICVCGQHLCHLVTLNYFHVSTSISIP